MVLGSQGTWLGWSCCLNVCSSFSIGENGRRHEEPTSQTPGDEGHAAGLWCLASFVNHSCRQEMLMVMIGEGCSMLQWQ